MIERPKEPTKHGTGWFPADVTIRDIVTGEVRVWATWEQSGPDGWSDFAWSDGNFGCDCNRYLFFEQAGGQEPSAEMLVEHGCGDERYRVESIKDARDGRVLYEETAEER